ncbi:MAG: hypothetical protein REH83_01020 [Rickettsiella sp.]|nr:hypothetical protein [Rickettsiella sp.]
MKEKQNLHGALFSEIAETEGNYTPPKKLEDFLDESKAFYR